MLSTEVVGVSVEGSPRTVSEELEKRRSEARSLELQVSRKEAELRRAKEEQELLKELQTMNRMITRKKDRQRSEGDVEQLKISPESLAELIALKDQLKIENRKTAELQDAFNNTAVRLEDVERSVELKERQLIEAKYSTGWEKDRCSARTATAVKSEHKEKKMRLASLSEDHETLMRMSERLKAEVEVMQGKVESGKELDDNFAKAETELRDVERRFSELDKNLKSMERIHKKTERVLDTATCEDKYKTIRQLEGDKRVLHTDLTKFRDNNTSNSTSILSLEVRLRQLETRLESVNYFLQEVFAEVEDDEPMQDVAEDAAEVPVTHFENLCKALELFRETVVDRDKRLDEHDTTIEQLERKICILQSAIASREASSQLQARSREKQIAQLLSTHARHRQELQMEHRRLVVENANLQHRVARA